MEAFHHHLTLLIIDDNVVSISTLTSLFAKKFNIEIAQDGRTALQSIMLKEIHIFVGINGNPKSRGG